MSLYLSISERVELILLVGENYKSLGEATYVFMQRHPGKSVDQQTLFYLLQKFKNTGSVSEDYVIHQVLPINNISSSSVETTSLQENLSLSLHNKCYSSSNSSAITAITSTVSSISSVNSFNTLSSRNNYNHEQVCVYVF